MSDAKNRKPGALQIGGVPIADLLPPEIALEAKATAQRRSLIALVIVVVVAVVGGYGVLSFLTARAQDEVAAAQKTTADLVVEQAGFADLQSIKSKSAGITSDQIFATSTEIDWKSFLSDMTDALPESAVVSAVSVTSESPIEELDGKATVLEGARIAEITLLATTVDVPDIVDWIDGLATLKGYTDSTPNSVTKVDDGYLLAFTMHVDTDALSKRFEKAQDSK